MRHVSWSEVKAAAEAERDWEGVKVYGIPRGGVYVAAVLAGLGADVVGKAADADVVVDDVVDSGATALRYAGRYGRPIWVPFAKRDPHTIDGSDWMTISWATITSPQEWLVFPWEDEDADRDAEDIVRRMIQHIGDDVQREGLVGTPERVVRSWGELFKGYAEDNPASVLKQFNPGARSTMSRVKALDIPFRSTCEHHMLPFSGTVDIYYYPNANGVIGISKLARLVDMLASRLQIQERLTSEIAKAVVTCATYAHVAVTASHSCVDSRGALAHGMTVETSACEWA